MRIAVAMSGGVDSSVAAALLLEQGHDVIGVTMKIYDYSSITPGQWLESSCCNLEAINDAQKVAQCLGIPHYVIDFRTEFETTVIKNFIDEYLQGRTPNPCILCNKVIKLGLLLEKSQQYFKAEALATGHYAKVVYNDGKKRFTIAKGVSKEKDQSYVLWSLNQQTLARIQLPLGSYSKNQVRAIAKKYNLHIAQKHESFEICFIHDNNYEQFLKHRIPSLEQRVFGGEIIYKGNVVGTHRGYPFYTIGQRRNIGAYGKKMYVTNIDWKLNRIEIGPEEALYHKGLIAGNVNWVGIDGCTNSLQGFAKVRYKDEPTQATLTTSDSGKIHIIFETPKRAITPGQSVVFYDKNDEILCGGIIETIVD
ncbi:MAG: tRNA 2-thiouridine(34) synthase MnmA [Bacteroidetes bacterium]|nr:tRNA 2-thiouridine(34) synthase MnmA [Bacteroidota bacterium]